ncbi:MAG TPA: efflux RND transporter permease subunit [Solimonas sp.]|nr:efflux RND transporter permease subunit [Solimonas sp.]
MADAHKPAFVARHALAVLAGVAALTLIAASQLFDWRHGFALRISVDPSLDPLIAQDDGERQYYETVRQRFGNDETILVVVRADDVYTEPVLRTVDALSRAIFDLDGVSQVDSLTTTPLPRNVQGTIDFVRIPAGEFGDPALPARLRTGVAENPLVRGQLVAADGRAAAIIARLEPLSDRELLDADLAGQIVRLADAAATPGIEVHVTGAPVVRAATSRAVFDQLRWVVPAIVVLLTGLLALTFRKLRGVLLPLATIGIALTWTFGTLAAIGRPLNLITSLVPPLLVTMGLAYCAHILSEFESVPAQPGDDAWSRVSHLLRETGGPVLLTGTTTGVGLLALWFNQLPAIREFAWLSAMGVAYTAILALTFLPAALRYCRPPVRPLPGEQLFQDSSRKLGQFDMRRRNWILLAATVAFVVALLASLRIEVGDQFVGIFPANMRVRTDYEAANRAIGGVNPLSIVIDGGSADTFTEPKLLRALERLQRWLERQPEVGSVTGLVDHVQLLSRYFASGQAGIPDSRELVKQVLFFGDGEPMRAVVNGDRSSTLISLRLRVDDTNSIGDFLQRLEHELTSLPPGLSTHVTGNAALLARSVQTVTNGQLMSVGLALLLIYACLALQFASFKTGALATLPTVLQTALYFGALGLSGVMLNATTSLVECLVLGLAVDDTIHYLARFNSAAKRTGSESSAAVSALSSVLRPITLTKLILAVGFLILVTGELRNQILFGWLAAFTLFSAWLVDVFVTPAFMSGVRIVTLWDSLRLNLGHNVQETIPLFAGLSARQARIFALMSKLENVPAGTRLIRQGDSCGEGKAGDPAGDIYVVIDGKLSVWLERDGERVDLNVLERGAVVGETGYFGQKRLAHVDTLTPVRVLRFDDADQERICRSYPRIAARVFLNLNRIQAERRAMQLGNLG